MKSAGSGKKKLKQQLMSIHQLPCRPRPPRATARPGDEKMRTLFIGEDSSKLHINNFLWAYSVDTRQSRILSPIVVAAPGASAGQS
jgi:hypothetical protein